MKKQLLLLVSTLFLGLGWPAAAPAHPGILSTSASVAPDLGCPGPTPTNLAVTNVTPTSITLVWVAPSSLYFKIDIFDQTAGVPLPPVYTSTNGATVSGLTPGHCYEFDVRSSYCENGPYGAEAHIEDCTAVIITETIMEAQIPTLIPGKALANSQHQICIQQATATPPDDYNNAFVGEFTYGTETLQFAMALTSNHAVHLGETSATSYFFDTTNGGATARCSLGNTLIFRVDYTNNSAVVDIAELNLTFLVACSNYQSGGSVNCSSQLVGNGETETVEMEAELREETGSFAAKAVPNPFTDEVTLEYTLPEAGPVTVSLFDLQGRLLQRLEETEVTAGQHTLTLPGESLPPGMYLLTVQTGQERMAFPLVKQE